MEQHRYLVAGPLWLDRHDQRLWHNGQPVRLGGKAFSFLQKLMERPRTLITKGELFDLVWPGVTVSESVLTTAAKEVRQALGDDARQPRIIETVHGRGYRFLPDVDGRDEAPVSSAKQAPGRGLRHRTWLVAALAAVMLFVIAGLVLLSPVNRRQAAEAIPAAHPQSIAVLPFADLSSGGDQEWFAAGLTEEILNSLARTPDLHVAARSSTNSVPTSDVKEIGKRLKVAHLLEGSVRRDGDSVRVTAQLIRASDGFHLWSQNYDRPATDVISIQEDIAIAIAKALKTVMSPEKLQSMVNLGTRSVEAYEEYLRGLAYEQRQLRTGDPSFGPLATAAYERARALDPGFAAAHWQAAESWFGNATRVGAAEAERRGDESRRRQEYLTRLIAATASSEGRTENLKYRSRLALMRLQYREALQLMQAYVRERPRDAAAWEELVDLAGYASNRRLMAQAAERIHTLSIESGAPLSRAITASVLALEIDHAVRRARQQLALRPGEALIQYQAHRALLWGGHIGEARAILERLRDSKLPRENVLLAEMRQACAEGGKGAREVAARIAALPDESLSSRWHVAMTFNDPEGAADLLRELDEPERLTTLLQFLVYPQFDSRPFPHLQDSLKANGVVRPPPTQLPFACPKQKL